MTESIRKLEYYAALVSDQPGKGAQLLETLADNGVNLYAFTGFPRGGAEAQLDFVPEDPDAFKRAAQQANIALSAPKAVFLIQGDDAKGAVARVAKRLADAHVNITAIDAVASGDGRYGAILWVSPEDVDQAASTLQAG
jgi:hypothetical protein